jgi:hypothetical protein
VNAPAEKCACPCHMMPGILIALFGLTFVLKNLGVYSDNVNNWIWPIILLVGGLQHILGARCKCCCKD